MLADDLRMVYDTLVQYASAGSRGAHLASARKKFIARTGDLFESDDAFERRISAFLEWYTLDGAHHGDDAAPGNAPGSATLLQHFASSEAAQHLVPAAVQAWQHATLSLFCVARVRADHVVLDDLLLSQRYNVVPEPTLVGLNANDIIAARVVVYNNRAHLTDGVSYFPKPAARVLGRIAKSYRKGRVPGVSKLDLVHRLIYLTNRCDRYRHVDPKKIFADGEAQVVQAP